MNAKINLTADFLAQVELFMRQWGYTDTEFGRLALGDPNFIIEMRSGDRSPTLRTVERIREFMAGGEDRHAPDQRSGHAVAEDVFGGNVGEVGAKRA